MYIYQILGLTAKVLCVIFGAHFYLTEKKNTSTLEIFNIYIYTFFNLDYNSLNNYLS